MIPKATVVFFIQNSWLLSFLLSFEIHFQEDVRMNYSFRTHLYITNYFIAPYLVLMGYNIRISHVRYLLLTQLKVEI